MGSKLLKICPRRIVFNQWLSFLTLIFTLVTLISGCQSGKGFNALSNNADKKARPLPGDGTGEVIDPPPVETPSPTPPPTPSMIAAEFTRSGDFLVSDNSNPNFNINLPIANGTIIGKVTIDLDVYVSNWDSTNPGGYHCLFWLQRGTWPRPWQWQDNVVGYMNLRGPEYQGGRIALESTINGTYNQGKRYSAGIGRWYHLTYTFDANTGKIQYVWSTGQQVEHELTTYVSARPIGVINNGFFIQFGTQLADEGPEAKTYGWKFSNLNIKFYK